MTTDRLTPVTQLAVGEGLLDVPDAAALAKRLSRRLMKDIHDQALYTLGSWPYENVQDNREPSAAFRATLGGALDPFSSAGKCTEFGCRVATATNFARSVALYVDEAIVTDPIASVLMFDHRTLNDFARELHLNLQLLKTLLPLVEDGVIRFASPGRGLCTHCMEERKRLTEDGLNYVQRLVIESGLSIEIVPRRDGKEAQLSLYCPRIFHTGQHEIIGWYRLSKEHIKPFRSYFGKKKKRVGLLSAAQSEALMPYIRHYVLSLVGDVVYQMSTAGDTRSTFLSGSRLETAFLASLEQTAPTGREIEEWEAVRSVQLPWVRSLSVDQIVQLRHDAPAALFHLRESLAARLGGGGSGESVETVVNELRLQAAELEGELGAYQGAGGRKAELALVRASFAFVLYGLVTDAPTAATALATALTALATLHPRSREERVRQKQLKGRAPYVLVRAKRMLEHRPS